MTKQEMQTITIFPSLAYQDYPVKINLTINRAGEQYIMYIQVQDGSPLEAAIDMSPHDLEDLNKQLQEELQAIGSDNIKSEKSLATELEAQLLPLAEMGHRAFKKVFGNHDTWKRLQKWLTPDQQTSIQIVSESFFLPWELLYPVPVSLDEPLSYEHFWGMNYSISRVIPQRPCPGAFEPTVIFFFHQPTLGLMTCRRLTSVVEKEIPFFVSLVREKKILLIELRALDPTKKREEFGELRSFLNTAFDLIHLACHASCDSRSHSLSHIRVSNDFKISLNDMGNYLVDSENEPLVFGGYPLVILNACETGNLNPLYTSFFAKEFLKHGARGVVATECEVPDAFAADFAQQLYGHLLDGKPLGESLLATRRYFLEKYHNPSGLLYSMYAPPSIRLAQTGG